MTNKKKSNSLQIRVPVSVGELFDKITILEIKSELIENSELLIHVLHEYNLLRKKALKIDANYQKNKLYKKLKLVNRTLWHIEDAKRLHEKEKKFDKNFIVLARAVYKKNDLRAKIKKEINLLYNSDIVEVKSYS